MKKTFSLLYSLSLFLAVPAHASIVLAPGETKVIGTETVACSLGAASAASSTFSRAYYDCVYDKPANGAPNGASNRAYLTVTYVSEAGTVSNLGVEQTQVADDFDACKTELDTLNSNRVNITKYTEVELCYQYAANAPVLLRTYVFSANGRIIPVRSLSMATVPLCVKEASDFNSKLLP